MWQEFVKLKIVKQNHGNITQCLNLCPYTCQSILTLVEIIWREHLQNLHYIRSMFKLTFSTWTHSTITENLKFISITGLLVRLFKKGINQTPFTEHFPPEKTHCNSSLVTSTVPPTLPSVVKFLFFCAVIFPRLLLSWGVVFETRNIASLSLRYGIFIFLDNVLRTLGARYSTVHSEYKHFTFRDLWRLVIETACAWFFSHILECNVWSVIGTPVIVTFKI